MNSNIEKILEDLNKTLEADKVVYSLDTENKYENTKKYLEYIIQKGFISSLEDIMLLATKRPKVIDSLAEVIRNSDNSFKAKLVNYIAPKNKDVIDVSGVYERIEDVPGYGITFNSRCIPEGVYIKSKQNGRC